MCKLTLKTFPKNLRIEASNRPSPKIQLRRPAAKLDNVT
jgi:hypothetical protein